MAKGQDENPNADADLTSIENCSAKQMVDDWDYEVVECLVAHPLCDYRLEFGYKLLLCRHPKRKEIVEKTQTQ